MSWPWQDRNGRIVPIKAVAFALLPVPGLWLAGRAAAHDLGARPLTEIIHVTGLWTIRILLVSLAVTPLRRIFKWNRLVTVRRMIGVAAAAYAAVHLSFFIADGSFDLGFVAAEIAKRLYLAIGLVALTGLVALAATSTDGMVRRLGAKHWQRLHRIVYAIGALGLVHYFMQAKLDVTEPMVMAGLLGWLLACRAVASRTVAPRLGPEPLCSATLLAALSVLAGGATMLGEAAYLSGLAGAPFSLVLAANGSLATGLRPGVVVLAATLVPALLRALQQLAMLARPVPAMEKPR